MTSPRNKDRRLVQLIGAFTEAFGAEAFVLVDHWDTDLSAIGLGRREARSHLVYVSVWRTATNRLSIGFETGSSSGSLLPYAEPALVREVTFEHAVELAAGHLGVPVRRNEVRWERV